MATSNEQAVAMLEALLPVEGALQIITIKHKCCTDAVREEFPGFADRLYDWPGLASHDPAFDAARNAACDAYKYPVTDPRHNVCLAVDHFEGPDDRGRMRAYAADGSYTEAYPIDLLARLQQAAAAGPETEDDETED